MNSNKTTSLSLSGSCSLTGSAASGTAPLPEPFGSAIRSLSPLDSEVLQLRHYQELSNTEVAKILEVEPAVASRLYVRALRRLRHRLSQTESEFRPFEATFVDWSQSYRIDGVTS